MKRTPAHALHHPPLAEEMTEEIGEMSEARLLEDETMIEGAVDETMIEEVVDETIEEVAGETMIEEATVHLLAAEPGTLLHPEEIEMSLKLLITAVSRASAASAVWMAP